MADAPKAAEAPKRETPKTVGETDDRAVVTTRDRTEVAVKTLPPSEADVRDQFGNNSDWPLFQRAEFVRAKPVEVEDDEDRKYTVYDRDGNASEVAAEEFEQKYTVVKGPHKQEF